MIKIKENEEYVQEYEINDYFELQDIIQGRGNHIDLREKCIFRGVSRKCFELIPSSLREHNIARYIDADYAPGIRISKKDAQELGLNTEGMNEDDYEIFRLNKNYEFENGKLLPDPISLNQFKALQELFIIHKFIDNADKEGLKVPISQNIREKIHSPELKNPQWWPKQNISKLSPLHNITTCLQEP